MSYGWMGKILRVDLANRTITKEELPREWMEQYIGCRGINDIILYQEVGPDVDPFSEDNKLIFGTGPLEGTPIGMGRISIQTKHPNRFIAEGGAGGFWGAQLKFAGYDFIVVEKKSETPVYLMIEDDRVELRDATHLWGKDTRKKYRMLREETGLRDVQVGSIGPAGENLVANAKVQFTLDHSGGKGCGTIMGDKKLAAIAVHGTGRVPVKDGEAFLAAYRQFRRNLHLKDTIDVFVPSWSFNSANMLLELFNENGWVHALNAQKGTAEPMLNDVEYLDKYVTRPHGCFCCPFPGEGRRFEVKEGKYAGITGDEREVGFAQAGAIVGIHSWPTVIKFRDLCTKAGLDEDQAMYSISWAMECYEKGILNRKDTDGIELRFGKEDAFIRMTEKIIAREGFGDILARGADEAARLVGKGSEKYALTIKGKEIERMPERNGYQMALALAVCEGGPDHTRWYPPYPPNPRAIPPDMKLPFDPVQAYQTRSVEDKGRLVKWLYDSRAVVESLPSCVYMIRGLMGIDMGIWRELYTTCTGVETTADEFIRAGERIVNLERAYIVREGFRRKDDTVPRRMLEEPIPERHIPPIGKNLDIMLDDYYDQRGWDRETAIPKEETLRRLGLDEVIDDFRDMGISNEISEENR
ncbi:MAG: aldehyde ferredoxin oxidoreductase family protein [Deltaproteobacteria bacterium]|nr:aldehyde ferredoxin oxidoreductase family protein [Deltaproteobacteria bacterium]